MLGITSVSYGGGDDRWMGSRHGVSNAKTGTLKASAFPDKTVRSGTPVKREDGFYVPAGTDAPTGFVINDHDLTGGDTPAPVLWHGRILVGHLPVANFAIPAQPGAFVYVEKEA